MDLPDTLVAEDSSVLKKRKWSSEDSAGISIPGLSAHDLVLQESSSHLDSVPADASPVSKKLRLPPKPPSPFDNVVKARQLSLAASLTDLPPEIVQHVLSFVDPFSLGRLIRTSRLFQKLLDPKESLPSPSEGVKGLELHPQNAVWSLSRRRWIPSMPRPSTSSDEYDMMRLVIGKDCQFCGRRPKELLDPGSTPLEEGPGKESVRLIWPFKIRSCSSCLQLRIKTDTEVFLSADSPLMPGLPFAPFTSSFDYIPLNVLRHGTVPSEVKMTKYFYRPQIDSIRRSAQEARECGRAATEEWLKGLDSMSSEHTAETIRFEQWEASGGLRSARTQFEVLPDFDNNDSVLANTPKAKSSLPGEHSAEIRSLDVQTFAPGPGRLTSPISILGSLPAMPLHQIGLAPGQDILRGIQQVASSDSASQGSQRGSRSQRPPKSAREIQRLKVERRLEIEKRCRGLDPPIYPDMLERLDAFVAAIQIPMALNENAWETLKSRLVAQRRDTEVKDEAIDSVVIPPIPGQFRSQDQTDEYWRVHAQKPIREKVCEYAEEFIKQRWGHGTWVTYANAPQFAAEVLQHTRSRYYEVRSLELSSQLQTNPQNRTQSSVDTEDQTLKLEHMKWVFDQTIKPRTELIRKELFLCNECNISGNRHFGFDSVIQHYASKHTSDLSRGHAVVYWKAEWPANPPFNPHPERVDTVPTNLAQTPTLEDVPYSNTSPNSIKTPRGRSAGWRSPGTMSLLSNQTGVVLGKQPPALWSNTTSGGPGIGIYHLQRNEAAEEAVAAWEALDEFSDLPDSLRAYMIIQQVVQTFAGKYKNEPSVSMFSDCLRNKHELQPLNNLPGIRCKMCASAPRSNLATENLTSYSLGDLLDHFQKAHFEQSYSSVRLDWKFEMILLPPPSEIRSLLERADLKEETQNLLKNALVTALSSGDLPVQRAPEEPGPNTLSEAQYGFPPYRSRTYSPERVFHPMNPTQAITHLTEQYSPGRSQVLSANRDVYENDVTNMAHTTSAPYVLEEIVTERYARRPISRAADSPPPDIALGTLRDNSSSRQEPTRSMQDPRDYTQDHVPYSPRVPIAMARTETIRSQAASGRGSIRTGSIHGSNPAEEFLRNFDSLADGAMEYSSVKAGSSLRGSKPQSLSGSQVELPQHSRSGLRDTSIPTSGGLRTAFEPPEAGSDDQVESIPLHRSHEYRPVFEERPATYSIPVSPRERRQSLTNRYIEYDQRGYPIERHYREMSPVNYSRNRQYLDDRGRRMELSPPAYGIVTYREALPERQYFIDESGRARESSYGEGQSPAFIRQHAIRPQREEAFFDHRTGRYYIERPVREYIELEDRYQAPIYRDITAERNMQQEGRPYERYASETYDDRYAGRR